MATDSAHVSIENELPLHAVGALEGTDAAQLEAHLATCPACRGVLAGYRSAAALLSPDNRRGLDAAWTRILERIGVSGSPGA
jgi:anti-sigma factor RsiW